MLLLARARALAAAGAVLAAAAACATDELTGPARAAVGYYRLQTADGFPVPTGISSQSGFQTVTGGDLLLRRDGSFANGVAGSLGGFATGTFRVAGGVLTLDADGGAGLAGTAGGDSVVLQTAADALGRRGPALVYARATPTPGAVRSGTYVLSAITGVTQDGGPGFVLAAGTFGTTRYVSRVAFDTLTFSDDVFVRQHRAQVDSSIRDGQGVAGASEFDLPGTYAGTASLVVLRSYFGPAAGPDTLVVGAGTLTRRRLYSTGTVEERYTRVR